MTDERPARKLPRYVLPSDLPAGLRELDDHGLRDLLAAAKGEARRRGVSGAAKSRRANPVRADKPDVTAGQERVIPAAYEAGVKPAAIARQFKLSHRAVNRIVADKGR